MTQNSDQQSSNPTEDAAPESDAEGHGIRLSNVNETVVDDEPAEVADEDAEGHGIRLSNVNETVVDDEPAEGADEGE